MTFNRREVFKLCLVFFFLIGEIASVATQAAVQGQGKQKQRETEHVVRRENPQLAPPVVKYYHSILPAKEPPYELCRKYGFECEPEK